MDGYHRRRRSPHGAILPDGHRPAVGGDDPGVSRAGDFAGQIYHTAHWPHDPVDFTGKRSRSSAPDRQASSPFRSSPEQADHLYVFQRTPNYSVPAGNKPLCADDLAEIKATYAERRRLSWRSGGGSPHIAHHG